MIKNILLIVVLFCNILYASTDSGKLENRINSLEKVVELNEQYINEIENEEEFKVLLKEEKVKYILSRLTNV
jgi:uncharacterized coiled-coil protein SlyX